MYCCFILKKTTSDYSFTIFKSFAKRLTNNLLSSPCKTCLMDIAPHRMPLCQSALGVCVHLFTPHYSIFNMLIPKAMSQALIFFSGCTGIMVSCTPTFQTIYGYRYSVCGCPLCKIALTQ